MPTGDGLLARLPPAGPLSPDALRAVCDAAERFGNGIVEITARGSIQVRGLSAGTAAPFTAALAEAGIDDASPAIVAPPLAGRDPGEFADVRPLVQELRAAIAAAQIGPGSRRRRRWSSTAAGACISTASTPTSASSPRTTPASTSASAALRPPRRRSAASPANARPMRRWPSSPSSPKRDQRHAAATSTPRPLRRRSARRPAHLPMPRRPAEPVGIHRLADGASAVGIALPFGQIEAATLAALVEAAEACGATAFAPAEGRTLLALGLPPADAAAASASGRRSLASSSAPTTRAAP